MTIKLLTILLAGCVMIFIIELIRQEKLTFKYASGWILVTGLAILLTIFDKILFQIARFFGFELASNFIFFTLLTVSVFLFLLMTIFLCQQNSRNDTIAQKLGILEYEIKKLKEKANHSSNNKDSADA